MRLLLDTHAFVWWVLDDPQLSAASREAIAAAENVSVSLVAAWEIVAFSGSLCWIPVLRHGPK